MLRAPGAAAGGSSTDPFGNALDVAAVGELILVTDPDGGAWLADPSSAAPATTISLPVGGTPWVAGVNWGFVALVIDNVQRPEARELTPEFVTVDLHDPSHPVVSEPLALPIEASRYVLRLGGALWAPRVDGSELLAITP
jgi:hypothetical protein